MLLIMNVMLFIMSVLSIIMFTLLIIVRIKENYINNFDIIDRYIIIFFLGDISIIILLIIFLVKAY